MRALFAPDLQRLLPSLIYFLEAERKPFSTDWIVVENVFVATWLQEKLAGALSTGLFGIKIYPLDLFLNTFFKEKGEKPFFQAPFPLWCEEAVVSGFFKEAPWTLLQNEIHKSLNTPCAGKKVARFTRLMKEIFSEYSLRKEVPLEGDLARIWQEASDYIPAWHTLEERARSLDVGEDRVALFGFSHLPFALVCFFASLDTHAPLETFWIHTEESLFYEDPPLLPMRTSLYRDKLVKKMFLKGKEREDLFEPSLLPQIEVEFSNTLLGAFKSFLYRGEEIKVDADKSLEIGVVETPLDEVYTALVRILELLERGVSPGEITLLVPDIKEYASFIEPLFNLYLGKKVWRSADKVVYPWLEFLKKVEKAVLYEDFYSFLEAVLSYPAWFENNQGEDKEFLLVRDFIDKNNFSCLVSTEKWLSSYKDALFGGVPSGDFIKEGLQEGFWKIFFLEKMLFLFKEFCQDFSIRSSFILWKERFSICYQELFYTKDIELIYLFLNQGGERFSLFLTSVVEYLERKATPYEIFSSRALEELWVLSIEQGAIIPRQHKIILGMDPSFGEEEKDTPFEEYKQPKETPTKAEKERDTFIKALFSTDISILFLYAHPALKSISLGGSSRFLRYMKYVAPSIPETTPSFVLLKQKEERIYREAPLVLESVENRSFYSTKLWREITKNPWKLFFGGKTASLERQTSVVRREEIPTKYFVLDQYKSGEGDKGFPFLEGAWRESVGEILKEKFEEISFSWEDLLYVECHKGVLTPLRDEKTLHVPPIDILGFEGSLVGEVGYVFKDNWVIFGEGKKTNFFSFLAEIVLAAYVNRKYRLGIESVLFIENQKVFSLLSKDFCVEELFSSLSRLFKEGQGSYIPFSKEFLESTASNGENFWQKDFLESLSEKTLLTPRFTCDREVKERWYPLYQPLFTVIETWKSR